MTVVETDVSTTVIVEKELDHVIDIITFIITITFSSRFKNKNIVVIEKILISILGKYL